MALRKTIVKNNGIETNYHKIIGVDLMVMKNANKEDNLNLIIKVESYLNKEYRDKNYPINIQHYAISLTTDENTEISGIRQFAYDKLKKIPEWSDAIDC